VGRQAPLRVLLATSQIRTSSTPALKGKVCHRAADAVTLKSHFDATRDRIGAHKLNAPIVKSQSLANDFKDTFDLFCELFLAFCHSFSHFYPIWLS
jgi:hypothetical protein